MSERTGRFVVEIGTGTVAHIIDMDADRDQTGSRVSLAFDLSGEKMCSRGNRHPGDKRVPFAADDTGRRHYRDVADHLAEMQGLVPEARFEEFIDFLIVTAVRQYRYDRPIAGGRSGTLVQQSL